MKFSFKIKSELGLHGRAAAKIVDKCKEYKSNISLVFNGRVGETDSIISLVTINALKGDTVNVLIDGSDEVAVYEDFKRFLEETL